MDITFLNPGADGMLESILDFQSEGEAAFWSDPLYHFYPQLDKTHAAALPFPQRKDYIARTLRAVYAQLEGDIEEKIRLYARRWASCRGQINDALTDAFGIDCGALFNDLRCHVSMNPISPRFLRERRFDVFYRNSERGALGMAIHELIHFAWFHVWNGLFGDSCDEYERPSLKWILSEMVVESVMRDPRLSSINPYFPREDGGCVYPYFFDMEAGGAPILDTLDRMYRAQPIQDFMKSSYAYCLEHEGEIRDHIRRSEG